jgi:transcriptional regulator with XRE-family HTH domain
MTGQVKEIAERLYGLRVAAGLSVDRMAEVTNTGLESYLKAENGETDFSFSFLLRCAKESEST